MANIRNNAFVRVQAPHKVEYQYRTILGIIGSWEEILSTRTGRVSLYVQMSEEPEQVRINGVNYKPIHSELDQDKQ